MVPARKEANFSVANSRCDAGVVLVDVTHGDMLTDIWLRTFCLHHHGTCIFRGPCSGPGICSCLRLSAAKCSCLCASHVRQAHKKRLFSQESGKRHMTPAKRPKQEWSGLGFFGPDRGGGQGGLWIGGSNADLALTTSLCLYRRDSAPNLVKQLFHLLTKDVLLICFFLFSSFLITGCQFVRTLCIPHSEVCYDGK